MAWIKVDLVTPRKPQVLAIARALGIPAQFALGALVAVWAWADQQFCGGCLDDATDEDVDAVGGVKGLAGAMRSVGWLASAGENLLTSGLVLPDYERHNGPTSRSRAVQRYQTDRQTDREGEQKEEQIERQTDRYLSGADAVKRPRQSTAVDKVTTCGKVDGLSPAQQARLVTALGLLRTYPGWRRSAEPYAIESLAAIERNGHDAAKRTGLLIRDGLERIPSRSAGWISNALRNIAGLPTASRKHR